MTSPKCARVLLHQLLRLEHRDQGQQAQARAIAVDALRVDERLAEHLQPAADAQHRAAALRVLRDGAVQPLRAQPGEVAAGVLGAGQDDPVGMRDVGRGASPDEAHAGNVLERLEFVEVADARIGDDGDCLVHGAGMGAALVEHAVFVRQAMLAPHRQRRDGGDAGQLFEHARSGLRAATHRRGTCSARSPAAGRARLRPAAPRCRTGARKRRRGRCRSRAGSSHRHAARSAC